MKASEMTNEELVSVLAEIPCKPWHDLDRETVHDTCREAASRLRLKQRSDDYAAALCKQEGKYKLEICELRRRMKVADDALEKLQTICKQIEYVYGRSICDDALAAIRKEGSDPCNARDGEGSSLRIGWEGEKEYCVVVKYRQDLQVELEDYDYHRVTGPLPLDIAKHWLDYHKRIRTKSEDPKILVREVSKWRVFDDVRTMKK